MTFREVPKETLSVQVPTEISERVRLLAGPAVRRSISQVATELICVGLGIDPREFGIEPAVTADAPHASAL